MNKNKNKPYLILETEFIFSVINDPNLLIYFPIISSISHILLIYTATNFLPNALHPP